MLVQIPWKRVWQYLIKLNVHLLCDPAAPFLVVYPRKMKTYIYRKTYMQISIAVLIIVQNWNNPKVHQMVNV